MTGQETPPLKKLRNCLPCDYSWVYTCHVDLLLVHCHPYDRSLCAAVSTRIEEAATSSGMSVKRHDLYELSFDPVLTGAELARRYTLEPVVQEFIQDVRDTRHLTVVHPDWWGGPPALLKGWLDRVFRPGVAYDWVGEDFEEKEHEPLLTGRTLSVFFTTDRTEEDGTLSIRHFWNDVAAYAGLDLGLCRGFTDVRKSTFRGRRAWLAEVEAYTRSLQGDHT